MHDIGRLRYQIDEILCLARDNIEMANGVYY